MKRVAVSYVFGLFLGALLLTGVANAEPNPFVLEAQKHLSKLKYFNGRQDGVLGPITQKALVQYQYETVLPVTGMLDDATLSHLRRPSIVLNTQNFAPFHFDGRRSGEADGPVPQIVKMACEEAGINCRVILHESWKSAQEEVKNGGADGMFVIAWNSERAQWLHRSTAIIETEYGLFVHENDDLHVDEALEHPSVLGDYTVGVYGPSGTASSLTRLKVALETRGVKMQINMRTDDKPLFRMLSLSQGKYAVYSNRIVGESIIKGLGLNNTRYAGRHRKLSYYVGFSKQRVPKSLVKKFDAAYMGLVDRGEVISIMGNYSLTVPKHIKPAQRLTNNRGVAVPRFKTHGPNGMRVVVDEDTCLMWQQSGATKHCTWLEAAEYVQMMNNIQYSGYTDWRLPTISELRTLVASERYKETSMFIHPVFDAMQQSCWSSDQSDLDVHFVDFYTGALGSKNQGDTNYVRGVRGVRCDNR